MICLINLFILFYLFDYFVHFVDNILTNNPLFLHLHKYFIFITINFYLPQDRPSCNDIRQLNKNHILIQMMINLAFIYKKNIQRLLNEFKRDWMLLSLLRGIEYQSILILYDIFNYWLDLIYFYFSCSLFHVQIGRF